MLAKVSMERASEVAKEVVKCSAEQDVCSRNNAVL